MKSNAAIFLLLTVLGTSSAFAGEYTLDGWITETKANYQGSSCAIMVAYDEGHGVKGQGGEWSCNSIIGQNMFNAARMAKERGYKVSVTLGGNGAEYKPVYSINVK